MFIIPTRFSIGPPGVRLTVTLAMGLFALVSWLGAILFRARGIVAANLPRLLLVVYISAALLSVAAAYRRPLSLGEDNGTYRSLTGSLALAGLALFLVDGVRSWQGLRRVVRMILAGAYLSAIVGMLQKVAKVDYDTLWRGIPGFNTALSSEEVNGLLSGRATGTGSHPIEFSVACACLIPLAIHEMRFAETRRALVGNRIGVALLAIGSLLAVSRAGFFGIVIAVVFMIGRLAPRQRINGAVFAVLTLAVVQFGAHGTLSTLRYQILNIGSDNSSKGRTSDYGPVFELLKPHVWTGIGAGTYNPRAFRFLDNAWLGTLLAGGIIGAVLIGSVFLVSLYEAGRLRRAAANQYLAGLAYATGVTLLVLIVCAYFFDEFSFFQTQTLSVISLGILGGISSVVARGAYAGMPDQ